MTDLQKIKKRLQDLINIQSQNGNYDCNEYMWGLGNGLILALATINDEEPVYLEKPKFLTPNESELGAFNFAFDMKDKTMKDEFFDVGMFELAFQARDLINKPGKYAMKIIVTELTINDPVHR